MPELHREKVFEAEVVEHLTAHGWLLGDWRNYDRELSLYTEDLFAWLRETQSKEWQKLTGSEQEKEQTIAARLVKEMDEKGSLAVLRHGFKHLNAKFELCQFKPSHELNAEVLDKYQSVRCRVVPQV